MMDVRVAIFSCSVYDAAKFPRVMVNMQIKSLRISIEEILHKQQFFGETNYAGPNLYYYIFIYMYVQHKLYCY